MIESFSILTTKIQKNLFLQKIIKKKQGNRTKICHYNVNKINIYRPTGNPLCILGEDDTTCCY